MGFESINDLTQQNHVSTYQTSDGFRLGIAPLASLLDLLQLHVHRLRLGTGSRLLASSETGMTLLL